ncbi:hypothetical protein [Actinotalea sp.]|uniref:hypothetical protein n=1 Tax=Actinotalea sp. TaxID=1872145 RepID=UPI00356B23EF
MAAHRSIPILPASLTHRARPHRPARPASPRVAVESPLARHPWSPTGTITAYRAQRGIQPW